MYKKIVAGFMACVMVFGFSSQAFATNVRSTEIFMLQETVDLPTITEREFNDPSNYNKLPNKFILITNDMKNRSARGITVVKYQETKRASTGWRVIPGQKRDGVAFMNSQGGSIYYKDGKDKSIPISISFANAKSPLSVSIGIGEIVTSQSTGYAIEIPGDGKKYKAYVKKDIEAKHYKVYVRSPIDGRESYQREYVVQKEVGINFKHMRA